LGGKVEVTLSGKTPLTVLVVEGDISNRKFLEAFLDFEGYHVVTASTAETALRQIREARPALVLTDIRLPGMDGLELIESIREDAATAHIPVIVITAHLITGGEETLLAAGFDGYMPKPVNIALLKDCIKHYLNR
jgi:two-component system cell cycle response regulator DivK